MSLEYEIYPYEMILPFIKGDEESISDKDAAKRAGVSERQIRNARLNGMNDYLLDKLCVGIGMHPAEIVGIEKWIATGINAPKIPKRKTKVNA